MFGFLRSKKKTKGQDDFAAIVAETLFRQIEQARDEAKAGGIITEKIFNDRLNSMYVAGYLVGYVDTHISHLTDDAALKKVQAESIFEIMFPGAGIDFVKAKLALRTKAKNIAADDKNYAKISAQCQGFDTGMADAEEEVEISREEDDYQPLKLKEFLLLGGR